LTSHPSHYALDQAALGAPLGRADAEHVAACARCAGILASRRAAEPRPPWLDSVAAPRPRRLDRALPRWPRWLAIVPVAAAFAAAVILLPGGPGGTGDAIRSKGAPVVAVYLKRSGAVVAWDGRTPIRSGDRLRLGIRGPGYGHVSVASLPAPPASPEILFAGPMAQEGETLLPVAFRVDERGAEEVLSVILGPAPVPAERHAAGCATLPPDRCWAARVALPREKHR
jgi:hypothetical protein